jgi:hypothetical protein
MDLHEKQFASVAESVLQKYVHLHRQYDGTVDTQIEHIFSENVLKIILQNEHELILKKVKRNNPVKYKTY